MLGKIRLSDTLAVVKFDRLGCVALDVLATIKRAAERKVEVIVLQFGKRHLGSLSSKLVLTMLAAVAEMERGSLIEHTRRQDGR